MNTDQNLNNQLPAPRKFRLWRALLPAAIVLVVAVGAIFWLPPLIDAVRASRFEPTSEIQTVTERLQLTKRGTNIFYATTPVIESRDDFNQSCHSTERTVAILGCYYRDKTYVYDIENQELEGAVEVTAAHELLHAAYFRLNMFDRMHVEKMLRQEYELIKDTDSIKRVMQYYSEAEPGAEIDELHSIIGTTVSKLPEELESYYARYFEDRSAIVEMNTKYTSVFDEVNQRAKELQAKLEADGPELRADLAAYDAELTQLNLDITNFNERAASSGGFASQRAFIEAGIALTRRVDDMNARSRMLNERVASYNDDVAALNAIAVRANQLNDSINGVAAPSEV